MRGYLRERDADAAGHAREQRDVTCGKDTGNYISREAARFDLLRIAGQLESGADRTPLVSLGGAV